VLFFARREPTIFNSHQGSGSLRSLVNAGRYHNAHDLFRIQSVLAFLATSFDCHTTPHGLQSLTDSTLKRKPPRSPNIDLIRPVKQRSTSLGPGFILPNSLSRVACPSCMQLPNHHVHLLHHNTVLPSHGDLSK
jgi:hypothetical protein